MKITKVRVDGYRLLNNFALDLNDNLSLVIGKNNTGKTSLLNILSAYLSQSQPNFTFEDFSIDTQKSLLSSLAATQLSVPEPSPNIKLELTISYDENDNLRHLSKLMVDLSPNARTVHLRFSNEILPDAFQQLYADVHESLSAVESALERKLEGDDKTDEIQRFLSKNIKRYLTHNVISFDPDDSESVLDLTDEPSTIRRVLNLEYVSARRSVENRSSGQSGKTAGRALSQLSSDYFKDHTGGNEDSAPFIQLAAQAAATDRAFTATYKKVFEDVMSKIKRFGTDAGLEGDIHVISAIQPTVLLNDSTSVKYGEPDTLLPEDHNGLGYLNLIAIIMEIEIRLLRIKSANNASPADINVLVIEEPEAHTHPQLQYIFIKKIKELLHEHKTSGGLQLQTMITTHSSHITAESDFADIKYFRRTGDQIEARNMTDLEAQYNENTKEYQFLKQYLTLTRAELFFADKAVLIEGDTERILMRAMMRKVDEADSSHEAPLGSQNVSVVEVGAHSQVFDHFIEFTGLTTLIITDIDSTQIVTNENNQKTQKTCPVSEGTHTSNAALKHYFDLKQSDMEQPGDLAELRKRTPGNKQLSKVDGSWHVAQHNPRLYIAYQVEEKGYAARSYEDAFIHINRDFIKKHRNEFRSLKNRELFADDNKSPYELARDCVGKKTHFALDTIFFDDGNDTWTVPHYIAEGLRWLRDA